jgi:hypothetical protein
MALLTEWVLSHKRLPRVLKVEASPVRPEPAAESRSSTSVRGV